MWQVVFASVSVDDGVVGPYIDGLLYGSDKDVVPMLKSSTDVLWPVFV